MRRRERERRREGVVKVKGRERGGPRRREGIKGG